MDEWDCYFDILEAAGEDMDSLMIVGQLFTEEQIAKQVSHPLFSLTADGYSSSVEPPLSLLTLSPIPFSAHVAYISHHVRELGTLTLAEAIRKMTNLPASRFGIRSRGLLAAGYFADLVIFDYDQIASSSSFDQPTVYPRGIPYVLVNGSFVVDGGEHTGARPGRVLRRQ
jgi:N-acyl-D-amino-acid deacylase